MRYPSLLKGGLTSGKQPMSVELTSGTGERTSHEATLRLDEEKTNFTLPTLQHCITGIRKPADVNLVLQRTPKISSETYYTSIPVIRKKR